jgi:hypothetical protein
MRRVGAVMHAGGVIGLAMLTPAIAGLVAPGPHGVSARVDPRGGFAIAVTVAVALVAYTWIGTRVERSRRRRRKGRTRASVTGDRSQVAEPLVDVLLHDLDAALRDPALVRQARRRVRAARRRKRGYGGPSP